MRRIGEIMDDIRGTPVCPESGEINLFWLIQEQVKSNEDKSHDSGNLNRHG